MSELRSSRRVAFVLFVVDEWIQLFLRRFDLRQDGSAFNTLHRFLKRITVLSSLKMNWRRVSRSCSMGSETNFSPASSSSPAASTSSTPTAKRSRDPEDEVYIDNLHSHKRYLSEVPSPFSPSLTYFHLTCIFSAFCCYFIFFCDYESSNKPFCF